MGRYNNVRRIPPPSSPVVPIGIFTASSGCCDSSVLAYLLDVVPLRSRYLRVEHHGLVRAMLYVSSSYHTLFTHFEQPSPEPVELGHYSPR